MAQQTDGPHCFRGNEALRFAISYWTPDDWRQGARSVSRSKPAANGTHLVETQQITEKSCRMETLQVNRHWDGLEKGLRKADFGSITNQKHLPRISQ